VKLLLKSLIVWLLLLAVPFQGFAAATMLSCAPVHAMQAAGHAQHDQHAMHDQHAQHAQHDQHANDAKAQADHAGGKCDACAACCIGAAIAPSAAAAMPLESRRFAAIALPIAFVAAVDLALPERPPQAALA
jgi:hypothetical protein